MRKGALEIYNARKDKLLHREQASNQQSNNYYAQKKLRTQQLKIDKKFKTIDPVFSF